MVNCVSLSYLYKKKKHHFITTKKMWKIARNVVIFPTTFDIYVITLNAMSWRQMFYKSIQLPECDRYRDE